MRAMDEEVITLTADDALRLSPEEYAEKFYEIRADVLVYWKDDPEMADAYARLRGDFTLQEMKAFVADHAKWFNPDRAA